MWSTFYTPCRNTFSDVIAPTSVPHVVACFPLCPSFQPFIPMCTFDSYSIGVLSPRLFCAALQVALANWRARVEHRGVDMNNGLPRLLDLRFADDMLLLLLLFAGTSTDASYLLDEICAALRIKTKVLTSEARAPHQPVTPQGLVVAVLSRDQEHRWLGCMLSTQQSRTRDVDFSYPSRLQDILCKHTHSLRQNCFAATSFTVP